MKSNYWWTSGRRAYFRRANGITRRFVIGRSSTDQPLIGQVSILYVYIYILLFFLIFYLIFYAFACNFTISWIVKHRGNIFTENIERKKEKGSHSIRKQFSMTYILVPSPHCLRFEIVGRSFISSRFSFHYFLVVLALNSLTRATSFPPSP